MATDVAEVIGTAIGLKLLFGIPLALGVVLTALDVFLVLFLQRLGFRYLEAFIIAGLAVIAVCFGLQLALAKPEWQAVFAGFMPTTEIVTNPQMLYLALGIIGATVMPHNLYLHSAIVSTRAYGRSVPERREALKFATIDSTVALMLALIINASILILAAAAFHNSGNAGVADSAERARPAGPPPGLGAGAHPVCDALLLCGLNSTVTATLAGQAVMEGFIDIKLAPWLRRLVTRLIAIVPAAAVTIFCGRTGDRQAADPQSGRPEPATALRRRALGPVHGQRAKLGDLVAPRWLTAIAVLIAAIIIALNVKLIFDFVTGGLGERRALSEAHSGG